MTTYAYIHHPGYGRDDHFADELIARAIRQLGGDTGAQIAAHVGFASHPVPMGGVNALLSGAGAKRKMVTALRRARKEQGLPRYVDCAIAVEAVHRADADCAACNGEGSRYYEQWTNGRTERRRGKCNRCNGSGRTATGPWETAEGRRA